MAEINEEFIAGLRDNPDDPNWKRVWSMCYRQARWKAQDHDIAGDIAGDAVERIVKYLKRFNPTKGKGSVEANFREWVKTCTKSAYATYWDKRKHEESITQVINSLGLSDKNREFMESNPHALGQAIEADSYGRIPQVQNPVYNLAVKDILDVVLTLPKVEHRHAVLLRFLYGWKTSEIADLLKTTSQAVSNVLNRAIKKLKKEFEAKGIDKNYLRPKDWDQHYEKKLKSKTDFDKKTSKGSKK